VALAWNLLLPTLRDTCILAGLVALVAVPLAFVVALAASHGGSAVRRGVILAMLATATLSTLVRNFAWIIVLSRTGPVAAACVALRICEEGETILFSRTAVVVGMVHVLLPAAFFMQYYVVDRVRSSFYKLARSFGATSTVYLRYILLPEIIPSLGAAVLLVFSLSAGFYITPLLLGGAQPGTVTVGALIEEQVNSFGNWYAAAGASLVLTAMTVIVAAAAPILARSRTSARHR
jgi:putative spermidine/putrescine transport system permease protein